MKVLELARQLYTQPTLIKPEVHQEVVRIFEATLRGEDPAATAKLAFFDDIGKFEQKDLLTFEGGIGVISINGVIGKNLDNCQKNWGGVDVNDISAAVIKAVESYAVDSILLDFNSPGGSVSGIIELGEEIAQAATIKPLFSYTDSMLASAAYWLAAGSEAIYASQGADVGSIGVYMAILEMYEAYQEAGYDMNLFKTGKFKGAGYQGTKITEEQKAQFQHEVDVIFDLFKSHVLRFRADIEDEVMQGQTFFGQEAMDVGLVDSIATRAETIADLESRGGGR